MTKAEARLWLSPMVSSAPTSADDYRRVAGQLERRAALATSGRLADATFDEASRWRATARRKAWADQQRARR